MIFVVGNSRSGTTMMARILENRAEICRFLELHFFEELWAPRDRNRILPVSEAVSIVSNLICSQREDYMFHGDAGRYEEEARGVIHSINKDSLTAIDVYKKFLFYEAEKNNKKIPCENTPRNVFYLAEILEFFPEARIINMIRDPRDILLSQKRKWRRWYLRKEGFPVKEVIRLLCNYHPITTSKLWKSSMNAAEKYSDNERVLSLRYEDVISEPDQSITKVCNFIGIDFDKKMLQVPHGGSSSEKDDTEQKGIRRDRTGGWQKGGVNPTEIYLCQKITGPLMEKHGYIPVSISLNPLRLVYYFVSFPVKIGLSLILNLKRMRNIVETIKRRLA